MKRNIKKICDLMVSNFRKLTDEFRFDGEYINHFAAIILSTSKEEISNENVKKIRKNIKEKTSRVSCFRGDILYMLSFLIAKEKNINSFIDEVIATYDQMLEAGFHESHYLVLSSYAIVKHGKLKERANNIYQMKQIYNDMKIKYNNVTNEEDYLECALISLCSDKKNKVQKYMDQTIDSLLSLDLFSKNGAQGLTIALLLNKNKNAVNLIQALLLEFGKREMKINNQFLPFIGSSANLDKPERYCDQINEVIEYICSEGYEYEFYIDKSFRAFIALAVIEFSKNKKQERFLQELLTLAVYSFILSKNQGIIEEVLA